MVGFLGRVSIPSSLSFFGLALLTVPQIRDYSFQEWTTPMRVSSLPLGCSELKFKCELDRSRAADLIERVESCIVAAS